MVCRRRCVLDPST